jgi:quercetin dioxygenase-like cupin family protein
MQSSERAMGTDARSKSAATRRHFNSVSLSFLSAAMALAISQPSRAASRPAPAGSGATRRDVIKERLPGEPAREISLVEVTYPPGMGSPPHTHANGVMAFVVSGTIASKVGDEPERTFHAGDAWWEPTGAVHRISRNPSSTESATLLAIYVAPAGASASDLMKPM